MSNTVAVVVGLAIVGAISADVFWNDGTTLVFLAKKMADLIEWLAFWR